MHTLPYLYDYTIYRPACLSMGLRTPYGGWRHGVEVHQEFSSSEYGCARRAAIAAAASGVPSDGTPR